MEEADSDRTCQQCAQRRQADSLSSAQLGSDPHPHPKSCPLFKNHGQEGCWGGGSWSFTHGRGKSTLAEFEAMDFCLTEFSILIISTDSSKGAKGLYGGGWGTVAVAGFQKA